MYIYECHQKPFKQPLNKFTEITMSVKMGNRLPKVHLPLIVLFHFLASIVCSILNVLAFQHLGEGTFTFLSQYSIFYKGEQILKSILFISLLVKIYMYLHKILAYKYLCLSRFIFLSSLFFFHMKFK